MFFGDCDSENLLFQLVLVKHNLFTSHSFSNITFETCIDKLYKDIIVVFERFTRVKVQVHDVLFGLLDAPTLKRILFGYKVVQTAAK